MIVAVIKGQVPAQKNDKRMAINRATGKPFPVSSKAVKEWQKSAAMQLAATFKGKADGKVTIAYEFYVKDDRRRDIDNMICTVNDAIVKAGLIEDDSWQWLSIGAADAQIDRENPRVILYISEE